MQKTPLWFLGTGSAEPSPDRNNLSILLGDIKGTKLVLIDCSGSPVQTIFKTGNKPENLTDVILTHSHTDHIYALPSLVHTLWLYKKFDNKKGLRIFGEKNTLCVAKQLINAFALESKKDAVKLEWIEISEESNHPILEINGVSVCSFPVTHGKISAIGLNFIEKYGKNIIYSSDAQADEKVSGQITTNTIILVQDCGAKIERNTGHAGAKDIAQMVQGTNIQTIYLVHFPELSLIDREKILNILSAEFSGHVTIPDDLKIIDIDI